MKNKIKQTDVKHAVRIIRLEGNGSRVITFTKLLPADWKVVQINYSEPKDGRVQFEFVKVA